MSDKILIIEDDPEIAALEQDYLRIHGYETQIAGGGMQGLSLFRESGADLIILDVMLPGIDGFEVLRELRKDSDVPVLMLSARGEDIDKIRGLGLGADDYMQKPFSPGELVARVGAHLARYKRLTEKSGPPLHKKELSIRGMRVDVEDRRVFLDDQELGFTAKEFDLLCFFAENPNRVWHKEALFERVWGVDSLGDSSTVVVHVKKIREKLELDPQNPQFIETVWGAGYRLRM